MVRTAILGVAAAAILVTGFTATGHAADPAHTKRILGSTLSTQRDRIVLLAGSPNRLIYTRVPRYTDDIPAEFDGVESPHGAQVIVKPRTGHQHVLAGANPNQNFGWSLAGSWLDAEIRTATPSRGQPIAWWNLRSGRHGRVIVPTADTYLTAAPGGATYITATGVVKLLTTTGKHTTLGRAFAKVPLDYTESVETDGTIFTASNGKGIVLGGGRKVRYIAFAHPGVVHDLTPGPGRQQLCTAIVGAYAACEGAAVSDHIFVHHVTLVPLNGGAPTSVSSTAIPLGLGISGSTLVWQSQTGGTRDATIASAAAGSTTVTTSSIPTSDALFGVSAFGAYITPNVQGDAAQASTSATHVSTLFRAQRAVATASGFALVPGRIAYITDKANNTNPFYLASQGITTASGRVKLSKHATVLAGQTTAAPLDATVVAAAPGVTAYRIDYPQLNASWDLHVVTRLGDTVAASVADYVAQGSVVALSGNRLLYVRPKAGRRYDEMVVRNLVTGSVKAFGRRSFGDTQAAAIYGHYVAYMTTTGKVARYDLNTGKAVTLAPAGRPGSHNGGRVFAYGNWVGWVDDPLQPVTFSDIRNAHTMAAPIKLSNTIVGMGPEGVEIANDGQQLPMFVLGYISGRSAVSLRTWSGRMVPVLSARSYVGLPTLLGHTLAWIDGAGALKAVAFAAAAAADPYYLGAPDTTATFTPSSSASWRLSAPYTLSLTACEVTISQAGTTVRTLACTKPGMRQGLAVATWNGQTAGGSSVPAGTYDWTVHGRGADGSARLGGGGRGAAHGTFTVS